MADSQGSIKSIEDLYNARPNVDNSENFEILWGTMVGLFNRLGQRFELTEHPSCEKWKSYQSEDGKYEGSLTTLSGPEVDWIVYAWTGAPKTGFANMHLNIWLGGQVDVPHLSFVFGTVPDLFAYTDCPPRYDLWEATDYLDKYYEPWNERSLKWRGDPRMQWFVSENAYMRVCLTPSAICHTGTAEPQLMRELGTEYNERLEDWIGWVDAAETLPADKQAEMLKRDRKIRQEVANRDPVNSLAEKFFGKPMTEELIDALWGVER